MTEPTDHRTEAELDLRFAADARVFDHSLGEHERLLTALASISDALQAIGHALLANDQRRCRRILGHEGPHE